jgi:tetrahydromethanopterin S-methyltransferase subunit F
MMVRRVPVDRGEEEYRVIGGDWRPVPDPTILTTQQLEARVTALREIIEARLDAYDKAILLLQETANRRPTIGEVVARVDAMFAAIDQRLQERELRFLQITDDGKLAVDKAEHATNKNLDNIRSLLEANFRAIDERIDDVRSRVGAIENRGQAYTQGLGWVATGVGIIAAIIGAVAALFIRGGPPLAP